MILDHLIKEPKTPATAAIIWMHGLGADGHDFESLVPALQLPDDLPIRFIFPHAPVMPVTINMGMEMRAWFDIHSTPITANVDATGIESSKKLLEGLIEREMAVYRRVLERIGGMRIFSYGTRNEREYERDYPNTKTLIWPLPKARRYHDPRYLLYLRS